MGGDGDALADDARALVDGGSAAAPEAASGVDDPSASFRWWLRLQVILTGAGGVAMVGGMAADADFFTGVGLGLFVGALALRFGRRACDDSPAARERR